MRFTVLGAGFGRTGTLSLKAALETLGFAPCHHMVAVAGDAEQARAWIGAARGAPTNWRTLLGGYAAAVDWPSAAFWREILGAFPNARVVLTVRDGAAWYSSFSDTIVEHATGLAPPAGSRLCGIYELTRELILDRVFGGRAADERHARAVYDEHNRNVRDSVPPDRLLVFDPAEGWAPLCSFLEQAAPSQPFPHLNARASFLREYFGSARRARRVTLSSQST